MANEQEILCLKCPNAGCKMIFHSLRLFADHVNEAHFQGVVRTDFEAHIGDNDEPFFFTYEEVPEEEQVAAQPTRRNISTRAFLQQNLAPASAYDCNPMVERLRSRLKNKPGNQAAPKAETPSPDPAAAAAVPDPGQSSSSTKTLKNQRKYAKQKEKKRAAAATTAESTPVGQTSDAQEVFHPTAQEAFQEEENNLQTSEAQQVFHPTAQEAFQEEDDLQTSEAQGDMVTDPLAQGEMAPTGILESGVGSLNESDSDSSCDEVEPSSSISPTEAILLKLDSLQERIVQVLSNQQESLRQTELLISNEGTRLESEILNSSSEISNIEFVEYWERTRDEFVKQNMLNHERREQILKSAILKQSEFCAALEVTLKNMLAEFVCEVVRLVTDVIENTIPTAVKEVFQRVAGDMAVNQLAQVDLEAVISHEIKVQFQTSVKIALQEALGSSMESSIIPLFETSCGNLANHVKTSFETTPDLIIDTLRSPTTLALRDSMNLVSSVAQSLTSDLADGPSQIMSLAYPGVFVDKKVEALVDPSEELFKLVNEGSYEEAFTVAAGRHDPRIILWLCSMVDLQKVLASKPALSQQILLSVLQKLAMFGLGCEKIQRLGWMRDLMLEIIPSEEANVVLDQVHGILESQMTLFPHSPEEVSLIHGNIELIVSHLSTR